MTSGPRSLTPRQQLADLALGAALTALSVTIVSSLRVPWLAYALAAAHAAPLVLRRRAPFAAAAVALVAALAFALVGYPVVGLGPAAVVWLYSIGSELERPRSIALLVVAELALVVVIRGQGDTSTLVGDAIVLAVAFLLGDSARRRRELLALHRDRADQLERTQNEVAKRAVAEERLRIARELHDVVAHSLSVIAVQAGTGRLAADNEPAGAREALEVIEATTRDALAEMRRLLGVLRDNDGHDGDAERSPAPTLDDVEDLTARMSAGGVPVALDVRGERTKFPPGLELAAYRILQEALTNVVRHAPGARARVILAYGSDGRTLTIEVTNPPGAATGREQPASGGGLGIAGIRERAAVYDGTVEAGPVAGGGFRVRVELRSGAPELSARAG